MTTPHAPPSALRQTHMKLAIPVAEPETAEGVPSVQDINLATFDYSVLSAHPRTPVPNLGKMLSRDSPVIGGTSIYKVDPDLLEFERRQKTRSVSPKKQLAFREYHPKPEVLEKRPIVPTFGKIIGRTNLFPPTPAGHLIYSPKYKLIDRPMHSPDIARQVSRQPLPVAGTPSDLTYEVQQSQSFLNPQMHGFVELGRQSPNKARDWAAAPNDFDYQPRWKAVKPHTPIFDMGLTSNHRDSSVTGIVKSVDAASDGARREVAARLRGAKQAADNRRVSIVHAGKSSGPAVQYGPVNQTNVRLRLIMEDLGLDGSLQQFPQWAPFSAQMLNRFADVELPPKEMALLQRKTAAAQVAQELAAIRAATAEDARTAPLTRASTARFVNSDGEDGDEATSAGGGGAPTAAGSAMQARRRMSVMRRKESNLETMRRASTMGQRSPTTPESGKASPLSFVDQRKSIPNLTIN
eukprot:TRINITY_DN7316_c0_g1_i1.p1 TRINITY_DN7316_c0_g1~~TRINITY_DN7316_c0_g1_i1.p1  ORF type:complete len:532 (+),score=75.42 TRINITY_DN7316_c0_g1_i1:203-1597(+)